MPSPFPPPTRYITGVDPKTGVSSLLIAEPVVFHVRPGRPVEAGRVWTCRQTPAEVFTTDDTAKEKSGPTAFPTPPFSSGTGFIDIAPQSLGQFHYTTTVDYCVVIYGTVDYILADDTVITLKVGDVVVARGVIHVWQNKTDEWARLMCTTVPSEELLIEGKQMEGLRML